MKRNNLLVFIVLILLMSCNSGTTSKQASSEPEEVKENTLSTQEKNEGWQLLFDGKTR